MRNKYILFVFILFFVGALVINAYNDNKESFTTQKNTYVNLNKELKDKSKYLLTSDTLPFKCDLVSEKIFCEDTPDYDDIAPINKDEYLVIGENSYLKATMNYWTMTSKDSNNGYGLQKTGLTSWNKETQNGVRASVYIKPETKIIGEGTLNNPFKFKEENEYGAPSITIANSAHTYTTVTITATAVDSHVGIKPGTFQFSKDNGSTWTAAQSENTYKFTDLTQDTEYTFKARVVNNIDKTGISAPLTVTTPKFLADFTYSGSYTTSTDSSYFYIKMLTSGTLVLKGSWTYDVFLVGGGGGGATMSVGGGGGYTKTYKNLTISNNTSIPVTIGAGGIGGGLTGQGPGGASQFYNSSYKAEGGINGQSLGAGTPWWGSHPDYAVGSVGDFRGGGGSGGGIGGVGGSNGGNGVGSTGSLGLGQGTTTRAFGEPTGELYAGGGGGSVFYCEGCYTNKGFAGGAGGGGAGDAVPGGIGANGTANTGGGGGAGQCFSAESSYCYYGRQGGAGGTGIVILRVRTD